MTMILQKDDMKRLIVASVATCLLFSLTACFDDHESPAEKVSESIEEVGEELDPNRSAGEKLGDAIEDAGDEIEDAAQ